MLRAGKNPKRRATKLRGPERTRQRLLEVAFREVYVSDFQSAGLKAILATSGVTKGALHYYFKSKEALGYASVEEIIAPDLRTKWLRLLQRGKEPIDTLLALISSARSFTGRLSPEQSGSRNAPT
jgi:TetR/AcrR family transcriptional regulator, transcriptional repressor for nem operon